LGRHLFTKLKAGKHKTDYENDLNIIDDDMGFRESFSALPKLCNMHRNLKFLF
jgi:hypothetical protein